MKLVSDEKLAKLIEEAFERGIKFGNSPFACSFNAREWYVEKLVAESLQKASEQ